MFLAKHDRAWAKGAGLGYYVKGHNCIDVRATDGRSCKNGSVCGQLSA